MGKETRTRSSAIGRTPAVRPPAGRVAASPASAATNSNSDTFPHQLRQSPHTTQAPSSRQVEADVPPHASKTAFADALRVLRDEDNVTRKEMKQALGVVGRLPDNIDGLLESATENQQMVDNQATRISTFARERVNLQQEIEDLKKQLEAQSNAHKSEVKVLETRLSDQSDAHKTAIKVLKDEADSRRPARELSLSTPNNNTNLPSSSTTATSQRAVDGYPTFADLVPWQRDLLRDLVVERAEMTRQLEKHIAGSKARSSAEDQHKEWMSSLSAKPLSSREEEMSKRISALAAEAADLSEKLGQSEAEASIARSEKELAKVHYHMMRNLNDIKLADTPKPQEARDVIGAVVAELRRTFKVQDAMNDAVKNTFSSKTAFERIDKLESMAEELKRSRECAINAAAYLLEERRQWADRAREEMIVGATGWKGLDLLAEVASSSTNAPAASYLDEAGKASNSHDAARKSLDAASKPIVEPTRATKSRYDAGAKALVEDFNTVQDIDREANTASSSTLKHTQVRSMYGIC